MRFFKAKQKNYPNHNLTQTPLIPPLHTASNLPAQNKREARQAPPSPSGTPEYIKLSWLYTRTAEMPKSSIFRERQHSVTGSSLT